jgi:hypothetical protein
VGCARAISGCESSILHSCTLADRLISSRWRTHLKSHNTWLTCHRTIDCNQRDEGTGHDGRSLVRKNFPLSRSWAPASKQTSQQVIFHDGIGMCHLHAGLVQSYLMYAPSVKVESTAESGVLNFWKLVNVCMMRSKKSKRCFSSLQCD